MARQGLATTAHHQQFSALHIAFDEVRRNAVVGHPIIQGERQAHHAAGVLRTRHIQQRRVGAALGADEKVDRTAAAGQTVVVGRHPAGHTIGRHIALQIGIGRGHGLKRMHLGQRLALRKPHRVPADVGAHVQDLPRTCSQQVHYPGFVGLVVVKVHHLNRRHPGFVRRAVQPDAGCGLRRITLPWIGNAKAHTGRADVDLAHIGAARHRHVVKQRLVVLLQCQGNKVGLADLAGVKLLLQGLECHC